MDKKPRNVRNFWIEGAIDGRGPVKFGGPAGADQGFSLTIKQRDGDGVARSLRIEGVACDGENLRLYVYDDTGAEHEEVEVFRIESSREGKPRGLKRIDASDFAR